jgi:cell division protein FtsB
VIDTPHAGSVGGASGARRAGGSTSAKPSVVLGLGPIRFRRPELTGRSMLVLAMALVLIVVLASPLQTYLNRRDSLSATEQQNRQLAQRIATLQQQSQQWDDPAYVERQARIRLQYVRPGDTLYTVINPDGSAHTGTAKTVDAVPRSGHGASWNSSLWASVTNADRQP